MRLSIIFVRALAFAALLSGGDGAALAQCALPHQLTNGQLSDATKIMANFDALTSCLAAAAPGGSTNTIQYNAGSGTFGGISPLTNGQLVIGSTGGAPQARTLTAGPGITITNSPGAIAVATTGGLLGTGLYRQIMSATPTAAGTGLINWLNQGTATVSDSAVGVTINAPAHAATVANMAARFMAAPTPPYKITVLLAATRNANSYNGAGIGWYNGTNKLHVISYILNNGGAPYIEVEKWNSASSWSGSNDAGSNFNNFSQPIWLQLSDDGTNASFSFSQDGVNFLQLFSVAKASGWLGATGYNDLAFFANAQGGQTLATIMSWTQN